MLQQEIVYVYANVHGRNAAQSEMKLEDKAASKTNSNM